MTEAFTGRAELERIPVLVTGGTGFTGGHLARGLRALGHPVQALVRPGADVTALQAAGVRLVEGDIRKAADVRRAVAGVRKIYHIAAVFRTAGHPDGFYRDVNRHGTEHVLEAAAAACVERTVHCSTIGVHGDVREIPCTEEKTVPLIRATSIRRPSSRGNLQRAPRSTRACRA